MVRRDSESFTAVILVDYKMKFEAIRYREKITEFFGKKGMSWQGAAVFHTIEKGSDVTLNVRRKDSGAAKCVDLNTLFIDHILSNDMSQDRVAFCSLLDAILARVSKELLLVKRFFLLSDNACCYQNDLLPVMIQFIAEAHGMRIESFVHSETQRGKSLIDAHFALCMMHINRYVNQTRNNMATPSDIVQALNSLGGVANCTAEMVRIRRSFPGMEKWVNAQKQNNLVKLGRVNEILYEKTDEDMYKAKCFRLSGRSYIEYKFRPCCSERVCSSGNDPNILVENNEHYGTTEETNGHRHPPEHRMT